MMDIIKSDIYKLVRDKQTIILIALYFIFDLLAWFFAINLETLRPAEILELNTADFGMLFLFVTISAVSIFAIDYSSDALKEILPYHSRKKLFISKLILVILVSFTLQLICYLMGILYSVVFIGSLPSFSDVISYAERFISHYMIILANIGFVLLLSSFFKQRYLINALTLISLLIVRFFPVGNGMFLFDYLNSQFVWEIGFNLIFIISSFLVSAVFFYIGYLLFSKREV